MRYRYAMPETETTTAMMHNVSVLNSRSQHSAWSYTWSWCWASMCQSRCCQHHQTSVHIHSKQTVQLFTSYL